MGSKDSDAAPLLRDGRARTENDHEHQGSGSPPGSLRHTRGDLGGAWDYWRVPAGTSDDRVPAGGFVPVRPKLAVAPGVARSASLARTSAAPVPGNARDPSKEQGPRPGVDVDGARDQCSGTGERRSSRAAGGFSVRGR